MYNAKAAFTKEAHDTMVSEGFCRYYAARMKAEYITQRSEILTIAEKWMNVKIKKGKAHRDSHDLSARLHGEYYFIKNGFKPIPL